MPEPILLTPTREILDIRIVSNPVTDGQPKDVTVQIQRGDVYRDADGKVHFVNRGEFVVASGLANHPNFAAIRAAFTAMADQLEAPAPEPAP